MRLDDAGFEGTQRHYDWTEISPTVAILESLAIHEYGDTNQMRGILDSPLHNTIETGALAALVWSEQPAMVTFTVGEYRVRIDGDGACVTNADNA